MKMREELEMYKGKTIELEAQLTANSADYHHVLTDMSITHESELAAMQSAQEQELDALTASHKKALESKENSLTYRTNDVHKLTEQVNNLQDILDVIPGVMPRNKTNEYGSGVENPCHVRLASVLAQKFM